MEIPKHPFSGATLNKYMTSEDGSVRVPTVVPIGPSIDEITSAIKSYKWKEEDFLLETYPKNGTHFMWEIMMMLLRGSAENITNHKLVYMIDMFPVTQIDAAFPSPRVLNTHYRLDVLPAEFSDRKTVVVMRNPKDACVSYFFHETKMMAQLAGRELSVQNMTLSDYIKLYLFNKDVPYGSYFDYVEYMWSLRHKPNILVVFFEDLKQDPASVIQKVNEFMGTGRSPELVQEIAVATNFQKMKEAKVQTSFEEKFMKTMKGTKEQVESATSHVFRKGETGDWKRHFTVADNELFDSFLENWKVGQEIPFKYV